MDIIQDFVKCPVCSKLYEDPRSLKCRHTLCFQCFGRLVKEDQVICPVCNLNSNVHDSVKDFRTQSVIDAFNDKKENSEQVDNPVPYDCTGAEDSSAKCVACEGTDVTYLCCSCDYPLCANCKDKHITCEEVQILEISATADSEKQKISRIRDALVETGERFEEREEDLQLAICEFDRSVAKTIQTIEKKQQEILTYFDEQIKIVNKHSKKVKAEVHEEKVRLSTCSNTIKKMIANLDDVLNGKPMEIVKKAMSLRIQSELWINAMENLPEPMPLPTVALENKNLDRHLPSVKCGERLIQVSEKTIQNYEDFLQKDMVVKTERPIEINDKICQGTLSSAAFCTKNGVLYSTDLTKINELRYHDMTTPQVNDIIEIDQHFIVASIKGLDIFDPKCEHKYHILDGNFKAVAMDTNKNIIFGVKVPGKTASLIQFTEKDKQWLKTSETGLKSEKRDITKSLFFIRNENIYEFQSNLYIVYNFMGKVKDYKSIFHYNLNDVKVDDKENILESTDSQLKVRSKNGSYSSVRLYDNRHSITGVAVDKKMQNITVSATKRTANGETNNIIRTYTVNESPIFK